LLFWLCFWLKTNFLWKKFETTNWCLHWKFFRCCMMVNDVESGGLHYLNWNQKFLNIFFLFWLGWSEYKNKVPLYVRRFLKWSWKSITIYTNFIVQLKLNCVQITTWKFHWKTVEQLNFAISIMKRMSTTVIVSELYGNS
jgi:hypothetical protein